MSIVMAGQGQFFWERHGFVVAYLFLFMVGMLRGQGTYWLARVVTEQTLRRTRPTEGWKAGVHRWLTGDGVAELKAHLAGLMPEGPWRYPEDQVSDASERLLAAEVTREQLYRQLHEELPYDSAVRPESYQHRKDGSVEIHQQIVIGRDSQKPIVLGKRGARIKAIGEAARKELSEILGVKVHLFLHVKVDERWSESREIYEEIGLDWVR